MLDMHMTDEERALRASVRTFAKAYFSEESVARWCKQAGLPDDASKAFVNLDFKGFGVVEKRNQLHYDAFAQVLVIEELCRAAACALPYFNDFFVMRLLDAFASADQSAALLSEYLGTGRMPVSNAASLLMDSTQDSHDAVVCATVNGAKVMAGEKACVANGEYAPLLLVGALDLDEGRRGAGARSLWLVPANAPGVNWIPERKIGQDMLPFATLRLSQAPLQPAWRLRAAGGAESELMEQCLDFGRLYCCAAALGEAQAAMEDAAHWVVSHSPGMTSVDGYIRQELCDMEQKLRTMRHMVYGAARGIELGERDDVEVALMKRYVPQTALSVASSAMQIMGGASYTKQQRVSRIWRDCRGFQFMEGDERMMANSAAPYILRKYVAGS